MEVKNPEIFKKTENILKTLYGAGAQFREGQYEAIEAVQTKRRVLVVQKTGWGKSLVYFVSTKLFREAGGGVTVVVSPLIVLMENQIEAANKLNLKCEILNHTVKERRGDIIEELKCGECDLLLVTPETLFAKDVQDSLKDIKIGLFVIDEAHCVSDWGHDFRLEYSNLKKIVARLPANVPILATTATANDRVVADLEKQLGGGVFVSRGELLRGSLSIQVLHMKSRVQRYGWILDNINNLAGTGIIYCLTHRDCDRLADFLKGNGVAARSYHSSLSDEENAETEQLFKNNKIKAVVATVKLGMGYDKGDVAFVIHYQMPQNIVSYYQQIGRAGRNIDRAYTFLLCGEEDERIIDHFIDTAFPTEEETVKIMDLISSNDGVGFNRICASLNIRRERIDKALNFLENDGFIFKDKKYYATPKRFFYDREKYAGITAIRRQETAQMKEFTRTKECYGRFLAVSLGDLTAKNCGKCANCLGREIISSNVSEESFERAEKYINGCLIEIKPRLRWIESPCGKSGAIEHVNKTGISLGKYGEGYGEFVQRDKYSEEKRFCEQLLKRSAEVLRTYIKDNGITHITAVPSLHSDMVEDFARRLAERLGLPYVTLLEKGEAFPQKLMENSAYQCSNAFNSFFIKEGVKMPQRVLLVDDIVDSRWTMTVCGYKLMESGCEEVYPFALADSSKG